MIGGRPIQVGPKTPRAHAEAYLKLHEALRAAEEARNLVTRFEDADRFGADKRDVTVVVDGKAVTMQQPSGRRGDTEWRYIVTDVVE